MRKAQRGFTLVELLVVVAVVGVLSAMLFGVNARRYSGNATTTARQIASTLNVAKARAVALRRIHMVEILPNEVRVWQSNTSGFVAPTAFSFVQRLTISNGIVIYDVSPTVLAAAGTSVTKNPGLAHQMLFRPDGSSTGGTIFVADSKPKLHRILVYKATGGTRVRDEF